MIMAGFESLPAAIETSSAMQPMTAEETAFAEESLADTAALGLVLTDVAEAISYVQTKALMPTGVDNADDLIRAFSKPRLWADGKPRANLPMFVVLEAIEKLMPVFYMSLFGTGKRRPFSISPVGKTTPEAARAKGSVLAWAVKQSGLKESIRLTLKTCLSYGFCMGWWGWESKTIRERVFAKDSEGKVKGEWKEIHLNLPTYECSDLKQMLWDPACKRQDVQKGARWIAKQCMITANDLDDMRKDTEHYKNIPTREELRVILAARDEATEDTLTTNKRAVWREFQAQLNSEKTSADPLQQPLEYIEYWTEDRVIGALQRKLVIRNQGNEWNELPGLSCAFIDVLGSAWGFGVARLVAGEQRLQAGVANSWIDSLALVLNPVFQALKGVGPGTQNIPISPGKVITEASELKALVVPDISNPAMGAIANSEERAARRVGANGGTALPEQALRTGAGVNTLTNDVIQRLQYFLEIFINMIYLPVLEKFVYLCMEHLQPEDINHILTEEEGKAWEGDILDVYHAKVDIDVIAGADLMAKYAAAQLTPIIIQLLSSPAVQDSFQIQGKKFDYESYVADMLEIQGVAVESYVQNMTPDDMKRAGEMNAARAKGMADQALEQQRHANDLENIDRKGYVQAGVAVVKQSVKGHIDQAQSVLENMQDQGNTGAQ
jgi:hypothetical protein